MALPAHAQDESRTSRNEVRPVVNIDRQKAAILGISISSINEAVEKFFQTHENFKVEELHSLVVKTENGREVVLSKIATIEMKPTSPSNPPK